MNISFQIGAVAVFNFITLWSITPALAEEFSPEAIYGEVCAACHGFDGEGTSAETPDFTIEGSVLTKEETELSNSMINGVEKPDGTLVMPPFGGAEEFTQEQAIMMLRFLRENYGS